MNKQSKKDFKKPIVKEENEDFLEEENEKKSIALILIAIAVVLGLIFVSFFIFKDKTPQDDKKGDETKTPEVVETPEEETDEVVASVVKRAVHTIIYLDENGDPIGKTQKVYDLDDRINEKAPLKEGFRFSEWIIKYNKQDKVYYCIPIYVQNVERIPLAEEPYLDEEKAEEENSYVAAISEVKMPSEGGPVTKPTYEVEITGEVEELDPSRISNELTIDSAYKHLIALRFNAPENVTKESIKNMSIKVSTTNPNDTIDDDQYHYNGENPAKTGRELLDSTDEEYGNDIFYFYYYQEVDTQTNTTIEVYWGNDPSADPVSTPPVEPQDEYIEVYNINVENVVLE